MDVLERTCDICDGPVSGHRSKRYCSDVCKREARAAYMREWREKNTERVAAYEHRRDRSVENRATSLRVNYGISVEDYERMLSEQEERCAICGRPETALGAHGEVKRLAVDHDHETGIVRGLLCARCNVGIGLMNHDPMVLAAAIAYLKE